MYALDDLALTEGMVDGVLADALAYVGADREVEAHEHYHERMHGLQGVSRDNVPAMHTGELSQEAAARRAENVGQRQGHSVLAATERCEQAQAQGQVQQHSAGHWRCSSRDQGAAARPAAAAACSPSTMNEPQHTQRTQHAQQQLILSPQVHSSTAQQPQPQQPSRGQGQRPCRRRLERPRVLRLQAPWWRGAASVKNRVPRTRLLSSLCADEVAVHHTLQGTEKQAAATSPSKGTQNSVPATASKPRDCAEASGGSQLMAPPAVASDCQTEAVASPMTPSPCPRTEEVGRKRKRLAAELASASAGVMSAGASSAGATTSRGVKGATKPSKSRKAGQVAHPLLFLHLWHF